VHDMEGTAAALAGLNTWETTRSLVSPRLPIHQMFLWCDVLQMVVGPEGPDATALTWMRAVLSGKEEIFAFGAPVRCCGHHCNVLITCCIVWAALHQPDSLLCV
jgi:hypothetical protein